MVTYVSKQNVRSEHSLEEVLQTGESHKNFIHFSFEHFHPRKLLLDFDFMFILSLLIGIFVFNHFHNFFVGRTDIAKRLKYVKDIMYRLISTNVK